MQLSKSELFLERHRVFTRQAREAAHQALFFLGFLYETGREKTDRAIADYLPFALHQAKGLIRSVYMPRAYGEQKALIADLRDPGLHGETRRALDIGEQWKEISEWFRTSDEWVAKDEIPDVGAVRKSLQNFLEQTRAPSWLEAFISHELPDLFLWLKKRMAFLSTLLFVVASSFLVEAVQGPVTNEWVWPLVLLLSFLVLPTFLPRLLSRSRGERIFFWEVGERPFRSGSRALSPGPLITRWPNQAGILGEVVRGQILQALFHLLWLMLTWILVNGLFPGSTATVYLILILGYSVIYAANLLDFADFVSSRPVRLIGLGLGLFGTISLWLGAGLVYFIVVFSLLGAGSIYMYFRDRRLPGWRVVAALFLVAVVLSIWGAITHRGEEWRDEGPEEWARLTDSEWPAGGLRGGPVVVMAASGGGSRAAMLAGMTLMELARDPDLSGISENLQAISSVSGGSLANAAYVARLARDADAAGHHGRVAALEGLVEALADDFIFPTLRGALIPGQSRGRAIESHWENKAPALGRLTIGDLAKEWRRTGSDTPPFPVPMFNSVTLDGNYVVITPIAKDFYVDRSVHTHAAGPDNYYRSTEYGADFERNPFTWVYYRDQIYGLEDLLPRFDPRVSQAVRASANFPFGFPVVRIRTDRKLYFSPDQEQEHVQLTDGGALSNSGMWSLFRLLERNVARLQDRGVLLLIVEASRMPEYGTVKGTFNRLRGVIGDQAPIGRNMHERMLDVLESRYGRRIAVVQIDLPPRRHSNVFTTWALDPDSRARLESDFRTRWQRERGTLLRHWRILKGELTDDGSPLIERRRPPLD